MDDKSYAEDGRGLDGAAGRPAAGDDMDEPIFGELVPLDHDAVSQASGLQPLAEDIVGERRDLAVALRQCFVELKVSVRRYAVLRR
ncbi:hypothetical protein ACFTXJ_00255 [Streptomyces zhihengii]|uniref:hypothetical protein n=1 Tax=Streptomyces zhihengii TaxID=1818004 RepID=UPI003629A65C